jgi:hypothetical protein
VVGNAWRGTSTCAEALNHPALWCGSFPNQNACFGPFEDDPYRGALVAGHDDRTPTP